MPQDVKMNLWIISRSFTSKYDFLDGLSKKEFQPKILHLICDALRDLVPFLQFKKREKHPWRSANFIKVPDFSLQLY